MSLRSGSTDPFKKHSDPSLLVGPIRDPEAGSLEAKRGDQRGTGLPSCTSVTDPGAVDYLVQTSVFPEIKSRQVRTVSFERLSVDWQEIETKDSTLLSDVSLTFKHPYNRKIFRKVDLSNALITSRQGCDLDVMIVEIVKSFENSPDRIIRELEHVLGAIDDALFRDPFHARTAHQTRTFKHREPIQISQHFAPDVTEFLRGVNRQAILLTRGAELLAEFVMVDNEKEVLSTYVQLPGGDGPIPFFSKTGRKIELDNFAKEVFEVNYPALKSRFAPLGKILTEISEEVSLRHSRAQLLESKGKGGAIFSPRPFISQYDFYVSAQAFEDAHQIQRNSCRLPPRLVTPHRPVDESLLYGNFRSFPSQIGGHIQVFFLSDKNSSLVRFVGSTSRKPATYCEFLVPRTGERAAESVAKLCGCSDENVFFEMSRMALEQDAREMRLFGSVVQDSYSPEVREMLGRIKNLVGSENSMHFGFISDMIPSLIPSPLPAAVGILKGAVPICTLIEDREPWLPFACQLLIDKECSGSVRLYSRLGGEFACRLSNVGSTHAEREKAIAAILRCFVEEPSRLLEVAQQQPEMWMERCTLEREFDATTVKHLAELAEEWWQIDPTFGYAADEYFPVLTAQQINWELDDRVSFDIPLPASSSFSTARCEITKGGIEAFVLRERGQNAYREPPILTIQMKPSLVHPILARGMTEPVKLSPARIGRALSAITQGFPAPREARVKLKNIFPTEWFQHELHCELAGSRESRGPRFLNIIKGWFSKLGRKETP